MHHKNLSMEEHPEEEQQVESSTTVEKKKKKLKLKDKKKRKVEFKGKSAYQIFQDEYRPKMRSEHPEANFGEISSLVAKAWKNLSLEEKEFYEQKSKEDREARKNNNIAASEQSENNEILIPKIPKANVEKISPTKKLKKLSKEKPISSLDDYDEDEVEKAKDEVQEKSGTVFDQVVEESKSRKRRTDFDPEAVDEAVNALLQRMFAAYQEDLELMKENQPATKKLLLLKDVVSMASKKIFQKPLMDNGFLSHLKNWLSPLSDGSLPSSNLRNDLYVLLQTLPTDFVDEPLNSAQ